MLHSVAGVLDAKTCRAKYKFKIENVTQLLEFHALSHHQTDDDESDDRLVRETRVTVLHFLS